MYSFKPPGEVVEAICICRHGEVEAGKATACQLEGVVVVVTYNMCSKEGAGEACR